MTKKTRQRKNIKRRSRKQSSRRRVMRQRGGWDIYKDEDAGNYGVAVYYDIEGSPTRRVFLKTQDDFNKKYYTDTNYGNTKEHDNMTVSYKVDNRIHYLLYKPRNSPY